MDKFGRNYILNIEGSDGDIITVKPPFTIEFDVTRNTLTSANVCQIRVFNLALVNRNKIRRNATDYGEPYQGVSLLAGYGANLAEIFTGNISQAWSVREGTNFITQIECFDGGFAFVNAKTDRSFPAGTPFKTVIASLMSDLLPKIKFGAIGDYPGQLLRGNTYSGNTVAILKELTGGGFFIDSGKSYALHNSEVLADALNRSIIINASTGLLGTPVLERSIARVEMLFEPTLNIGRIVKVESSTESRFNGEFKVIEVKHRGMISESVAGSVTTSAGFFLTINATRVKGSL